MTPLRRYRLLKVRRNERERGRAHRARWYLDEPHIPRHAAARRGEKGEGVASGKSGGMWCDALEHCEWAGVHHAQGVALRAMLGPFTFVPLLTPVHSWGDKEMRRRWRREGLEGSEAPSEFKAAASGQRPTRGQGVAGGREREGVNSL